MGDRGYEGLLRVTIAVAALEAAFSLLCVIAIIAQAATAGAHLAPYAFYAAPILGVPILVIVSSRSLLSRSMSDRGCLISWFLWLLLCANLIYLPVYLALSGAGF